MRAADSSSANPCVCGFGEAYPTLDGNLRVCSVCGGLVGSPEQAVEESGVRAVKTVLVVDDQPFFRERLTAIIQDHGNRVIQAVDGLAAIRAIAETCLKPGGSGILDLMILDLVMPGDLDGFQTLAVVNAIVPNMPVVILTSSPPTKELLGKLARLGARRYLNKSASTLDNLVLKSVQELS